MSERWSVVSIDEIELPALVNAPYGSRLRSHFGIESFGVNAWRADPGKEPIPEHDEASDGGSRHEEVYVVLAGRATFVVDGETFDATPGTVVFVRDPALKRKATAEEPGTRILAIGATRGEVFEPSGWEQSVPALDLFAIGDYDGAAELLERQLEQTPDDGAVLYNLACAHSKRGRPEDSLEHLERAIEQGERFREMAREDSDFDEIRDEPRFRELVGAPD